MHLYLININDCDEIDINRMTNLISIESIPDYRYFNDVKRYILSEVLKCIGYKFFTGIDDYPIVKRGKYGKPLSEITILQIVGMGHLHLALKQICLLI